MEFRVCKHCGNIVSMVKDSGVSLMCCGEKMSDLVAGVVDASLEKHVPVYEIKDNKKFEMDFNILGCRQSNANSKWCCKITPCYFGYC